VVELWRQCGLTRPWNDPYEDIALKIAFQPELFFVGTLDGRVIASLMAGYEGHRGWIQYLGVSPDYQRQGIGSRIVMKAEQALRELGCVKINLQVRETNQAVIAFYEKLGFSDDHVLSLGKRLAGQLPGPAKEQL
jgi:ribosomal protein S18 acetylase RimI-like enzyme